MIAVAPRTLAVSLGFIACLTLIGKPALADVPIVEPSNEETTEAEAAIASAQLRFEYGLRLARSGNWHAALVEFEASIAAVPNRSSLYNYALCLRNIYRYSEAITAFERYLEFVGEDISEAGRNEISTLVDTMRSMLTPVTLRINRSGATVFVDDREVGSSPMTEPLLLLAGRHEVRVVLPGYLDHREDVQVVTGRALDLDIELSEEPRQGTIRVSSNVEEAVVWVDGEEAGLAGFPFLLEEGLHTIEVRAVRYQTVLRRVVVEADREQLLEVNLERPFRFPRSVFWSAVGLITAGTIATVCLGVSVVVLNDEYNPYGDDAVTAFDRGDRLVIGTDVVLAATLTLAVATLVIGLFTDWHRQNTATGTEVQLESLTHTRPRLN